MPAMQGEGLNMFCTSFQGLGITCAFDNIGHNI